MAGSDALNDCSELCYEIMSAVLACEFEGLHWGIAWMYRECPKGEWLVWSLDVLRCCGFCTCACEVERLHGDWLVVQNMENVKGMPPIFYCREIRSEKI